MTLLRHCYESLCFIYHPMVTMLPYKTNFQHGTALECDYFQCAHTHTFITKIKYNLLHEINRAGEKRHIESDIKTCSDKYKKYTFLFFFCTNIHGHI